VYICKYLWSFIGKPFILKRKAAFVNNVGSVWKGNWSTSADEASLGAGVGVGAGTANYKGSEKSFSVRSSSSFSGKKVSNLANLVANGPGNMRSD
jgi:hypothetical protein